MPMLSSKLSLVPMNSVLLMSCDDVMIKFIIKKVSYLHFVTFSLHVPSDLICSCYCHHDHG